MCGLTLFFLFGIVLLFEMGEKPERKKTSESRNHTQQLLENPDMLTII